MENTPPMWIRVKYAIFSIKEIALGGELHIYILWVRVRAIGKGIYFPDIGIKTGINFPNFGVRNGTDIQDFGMKCKG